MLPVNLAGTRIVQLMKAAEDGNTHVVTGTFARLTLSNLRKGSSNYWCSPLYSSSAKLGHAQRTLVSVPIAPFDRGQTRCTCMAQSAVGCRHILAVSMCEA